MLPFKISRNIVLHPVGISMRFSRRFYFHKNEPLHITSLEGLANLKSLDNVDPVLIQTLINEKTSELNLKNEIRELKSLQEKKEQMITSNNQVKLNSFTRPCWIFFLMSSSVYLFWQLVWWNLAYNEQEVENLERVTELEAKLQKLMLETNDINKSSDKILDNEPASRKISFYKWW